MVLTPPDRAAIIESLAPRWERADIAQALATHDIATVYKAINRERGLPQRTLAALTDQSQADIMAGRQVRSYPLLTRIADNLGIPRWRMGLSTTPPPSTPTTTTATEPATNKPKGQPPTMHQRATANRSTTVASHQPAEKRR